MSDFIEADHPRDRGRFTEKDQTAAEVEISAFIADSTAPFDLDEDEILTLSHAEGDFDASELGVEGIDLFLDADTGQLRAEAYTDLDFHHLAAAAGVGQASSTAWLDEHKAAIADAVRLVIPGARLNDRNGSWEMQTITADVTAANGGELPHTPGGIVDVARTAPGVVRLNAELQDGRFWAKVHRMTLDIEDDHDQELAGIAKLGRQGRI